MSNKINASSEALRDFASQIKTFIDDQERILSKLHSNYVNVGANWNDKQYQKFGQSMNTIVNDIRKIIPMCEESIIHLKNKADIIDEYNS